MAKKKITPLEHWDITDLKSPFHSHRFFDEEAAIKFYETQTWGNHSISTGYIEIGYYYETEKGPYNHARTESLIFIGSVIKNRGVKTQTKYYTSECNKEAVAEILKTHQKSTKVIDDYFNSQQREKS